MHVVVMRVASYGQQMRRMSRKISIGHVFDLDFRKNSFSYVLIPICIAQLLLYMSTARDNVFPIGAFLVTMVLVGKYTNNAIYKLGIPVLLSFVMVRYDILKQNFWEGLTEDVDDEDDAGETNEMSDDEDDEDDKEKGEKGHAKQGEKGHAKKGEKKEEKGEKGEKGQSPSDETRRSKGEDPSKDSKDESATSVKNAASALLADLKKHQNALPDKDDDRGEDKKKDTDVDEHDNRDGFSNRVTRGFASNSQNVSNPSTDELNHEIDALDTTLGRIEKSYDRIMNFGSKLGIEKQLSGLTKSLDITGILNQQTKL